MTQKILEEAKMRLQEVEGGISTLQAKYRECITKKEELELKCEQCEQRLRRSDKVHAPVKMCHEEFGWWNVGPVGGPPHFLRVSGVAWAGTASLRFPPSLPYPGLP